MKNKRILSIIAASAASFAVFACSGDKAETTETTQAPEAKVAKLTYVNWAEGVAYTHLAQAVLEDKMGYEVELTMADVGPAYTAVANGNQDAFMECWPAIHEDYLAKTGENLVDLGSLYEGTALGLVVPSYVTIDKISELNAHKDKFKGVITGIDSGAGMMKQTKEEIIPDYGLDLELVASSGPAMTAALSAAIEKKEWIVVTGWRPHWMFGRWDLKLLKQDPDKVVWNEGEIHVQANKNLPTEKPTLAKFLSNMHLTDAQLSDLMLKVKESEYDVSEVAREWMATHEDVVNKWIP